MKYIYTPIVFLQDSESDKVIDMLEEGSVGAENAFQYLRQWETGEEEGTGTIPYGTCDRTHWIDVNDTLSYVIAYRYGLYVSLTRVDKKI